MNDDKLRKSAEHITMPDELKNRIIDQCDDIYAAEKRNDIGHNDHVSGVERVESHPIRRTITAVAACAVLAAGVGTGIHFMPKNGGGESASDASEISETGISSLPAEINELLDMEFVCQSSIKLTAEQRNDIKNIVSEYEWTEIEESQFGNVSEAKDLFYFEAKYGDDSLELVLFNDDRAVLRGSKLENDIYYSVKCEEMIERIENCIYPDRDAVFPDVGTAVPPLAGIAEREYKEISLSSKEPISEEKRMELDKLISETDFSLIDSESVVYGVPAYFFTDDDVESLGVKSNLTYFYSNGIAEVREYGQKWFYSYDFDTFSNAVDEILFSDSIVTGDQLVCANMLSENVSIHSQKHFENEPLSDEGKQVIYDFFRETKFRKISDFDDIQAYFCKPGCDFYNKQLGFSSYDFFCEESMWSMLFYDVGKLEVIDYVNGEQNVSYYLIYDTVGLDTSISKAFPEISSSYPPFGSLYKMGEVKVNGKAVEDYMKKNLSNAFFGYDYSNDVISDSFRDETPVYTVETNVNDRVLTIRVYEDGTVEYNDDEGKVHTFEDLGYPETMAESLLSFDISIAIDPNYYE